MAITLKKRYETEFNPKTGVIGTLYTKNQYSKDISGGGYSGQPFIKRPIPGIDNNPVGQYYDLTTQALSLDFPIRGGSYEEIASREDFARIDRFFLQYPQGKAFTDKYQSLLRSNPKIETGRSAGDSNTRVFPIGSSGLGSRNMIEQVASVATGFHIPNAGPDINALTSPQNLYEQIVAKKPTYENRLVSLYNLKLLLTPEPEFNKDNPTVINGGLSRLRDTVELMNYDGGPNSLYGIGSTLIRRATDNKGAIINTYDAPTFVGPSNIDLRGNVVQSNDLGTINVQLDYNNFTGVSLVYNEAVRKLGEKTIDDVNELNFVPNLAQQTGSLPTSPFTSTYSQLMQMGNNATSLMGVSDFRKNVENPNQVASTDYSSVNVNKATRVGIGHPGARKTQNTKDTNDTNEGVGQDKVNMYNIQTLTDPKGIRGFSKVNENRDLIKFVFETVDNDNPSNSDAMFFRAFLTGYSDNHSADWQSKRYAGRGENFYTYQGFDRSVSFNFKVAAQSKQEMKYLYRKLNSLLSSLYPDYNSAGFMRGNITKLTLGDLFVRTPGILTSLNLTVDDQYAWEIAMNEPEGGDDMLETPQIIDVAVSFKPILNTLPRKGKDAAILLTAGESVGSIAYSWLNAQ